MLTVPQLVSSCVPVITWLCSPVKRFQSRPTNELQIARRTKSKNRMQIAEFPARLSQHKRVLREIQGM